MSVNSLAPEVVMIVVKAILLSLQVLRLQLEMREAWINAINMNVKSSDSCSCSLTKSLWR